ncbi:MAG TPA: methyltransferase domain-containing protein [Dehalococcoidia bacterium]|nr:methyltransferase domain-containing protein [Dehalococcoidia bacterium]
MSVSILTVELLGSIPVGWVADVAQIPFCDKAFGAAFTSHVLEHLPTIGHAKKALEELNRVADAVFIAHPSRQSIGAWLHPGHNLWIWQNSGMVYVQARSGSEEAPRDGMLPTILRRETAVVRLCYEDCERCG